MALAACDPAAQAGWPLCQPQRRGESWSLGALLLLTTGCLVFQGSPAVALLRLPLGSFPPFLCSKQFLWHLRTPREDGLALDDLEGAVSNPADPSCLPQRSPSLLDTAHDFLPPQASQASLFRGVPVASHSVACSWCVSLSCGRILHSIAQRSRAAACPVSWAREMLALRLPL